MAHDFRIEYDGTEEEFKAGLPHLVKVRNIAHLVQVRNIVHLMQGETYLHFVQGEEYGTPGIGET